MDADRLKVIAVASIGEGPRRVCGVAFAILMFFFAVLHLYWALGGTWGLAVASDGLSSGGDPLSSGMRLVMWGFALVLPAAAVLALMRVGAIRDVFPNRLTPVACWGIALVVLGVTIGAFSGDADLWGLPLRGPVCLLAFILTLVIALPGRALSRRGVAE